MSLSRGRLVTAACAMVMLAAGIHSATDTWKALAPLTVKRCSAVAEAVDGRIYLIGGLEPMEDGKGTRVSGRNQMYDPAANTWSERSPMPTTRNHAMAGAVNGKIYV